MKNILISVITVLLTILIIVAMVKGITIGKIEILSVADIKLSSDELDKKIENLNVLKNVTYKKKLSDLETSTKSLTKAKEEYLDLASTSTDEELQEANQKKVYSMEFLWDKVGGYATKNGLTLKWVASPASTKNIYTLEFTLSGSYIGVINYISNIENDTDLAFRIENFKITSGSSENQLNATFTVSNIGIKQESTSTKATTNKNTSTNTNKETNTTTEKTDITDVKDTDTSAEDRIDAAVNG